MADVRLAVWQTCDWIRILWHPSAYNGEDARRLPLCLEPSEAARAELAGFEKALVAQLASRTVADPKIFGRLLTTQDMESRFVSCLKKSTRGNPFIKLKLCLDRAPVGSRAAASAGAGVPDQSAVQAARRAEAGLADERPVRSAD